VLDLSFDCHSQDWSEITNINWIFEAITRMITKSRTSLEDPLLGRRNWITRELDTHKISSTNTKNPVEYTLFQGRK